jgi:hypothetical protein
VYTAIESLCESAPGKGGALSRWDKLTARLQVWDEVTRLGYDERDIADIQKRLKAARNAATHGRDVVLLDLGFPQHLDRPLQGKRIARGEELAFSALHADLRPCCLRSGW